jgi:hypothetical protein
MPHPACSRTLAVLVLGATLLAPAASAAPHPHPATVSANVAQQGSLDLLATKLWTSFTGLWRDAGCSLDPSGRCWVQPSSPSADNGCSIDPSGIHCAGGPRVTPALDNGCSLDPNGRCK